MKTHVYRKHTPTDTKMYKWRGEKLNIKLGWDQPKTNQLFSDGQRLRGLQVTDREKTGRCLGRGGLAWWCGGGVAGRALPQAWGWGCTHCGRGWGRAVSLEALGPHGSSCGE